MNRTDKPKGKHSTLIKYVLILLASALAGFTVSMGLNMAGNYSGVIGDKITAFISDIIIPVQWIVFLSITVVSIILYFLALGYVKKAEKDENDDDIAEKANTVLGWGMTLSSANMILCYGLFGLGASLPMKLPYLISGVAILIPIIVYCSIYNTKSVALIKRINPEKKGDPLDFKFQKQWIDSCDEAEKMFIYQAAYYTFRLLGYVILAVWLVTVICSMFLGLNGYAVTVITVIWFAHTIGYQYYSMKQGRRK